jgi:transposase
MMIPEKVFQQILALGESWRVLAVDYVEKERQVVVRVEETAQLWAGQCCPHCASSAVGGYDHAPERRWRHLNVCQLTTEIACALPRGQCRQCHKVFTVRAPWEGRGKHFTQEYEAFALLLMREMPVAKAGEILGETDQRLWRVLFAHVQAARTELTWANVVWVGADEMNRRKGHHYLAVFVDLDAKRVLLAVEGKDASVWERFAEELGRHNGHPKAITQVAIDMSPAYVKGVRENLGSAAIVFDKFHVLSHGVSAVDEVRRAEARGDATARAQLEKTHWLWRKNPERWTQREGQRWESLREQPLVTGLAYAMRLGLQNVYRCGTVAQARRKFADWCAWVRASAVDAAASLLAPMVKVADLVERHLEGILGHWKDGLTTAFLEGLNSLFSATKRKARGYRCSEYQIAMLYFVAGKLKIPCY